MNKCLSCKTPLEKKGFCPLCEEADKLEIAHVFKCKPSDVSIGYMAREELEEHLKKKGYSADEINKGIQHYE